MKILFCNYEYPPLGGGGGVVMAALARELARRHSVTVLTSRALGLPAQEDDAGATVIRVPVFFRTEKAVANVPSMLAYLPMGALRARSLRREGFDVINTHFAVPTGPLGDWLSRRLGIPNVLSVHGGDLYDPSKRLSPHRIPLLRGPIRRLLERADALVGQSRNTLQNVGNIYGVSRRSELIPLGIDRPPQVTGRRADFGIPESAFVVVTVGRVVPRKATPQLVQALAGSGRSDMHLLVVGDGPDADHVRAAAAAAGIAGRVHLTGTVSEQRKYEALAIADAFASATQHEGFGLVFLEAMAYGLPVVCYDHGGQTDFLTTGETGMVIPLNDLERFKRALVELHDEPAERRRISEHNRRLIEDYFIDKCAERYETLFRTVIESGRRRAGEH